MKRSIAAVLLVAAACKPPRPGDQPAPVPLRVCIQNQTGAYGNIRAQVGPVMYTVLPGQEQCRDVPGAGPYVQMRAVTTAGGVDGPREYSNRLQFGAERCWTWRLTGVPSSAGDLTPCDDAQREKTAG